MFEFFLTSDIHFGYYRGLSEVLEDGTTTRLREIAEVVEAGIRKAGCEYNLIAGDILVQSKNIDYTLGNFVKSFFRKLPGKILVFPGNHDVRSTFGRVHSILRVILPDNVTYIDQPTSIQMAPGLMFHFVPFHPNIDKLKANIEDVKINQSMVNVLVSHFSVEKAFIRDDFSVTVSKKWEAIRLSLLKRFDFVILGDIHKSQMVDDFVFYPGSPCQLSFNEEGQEKATWKVTISDQEIQRSKIVTRSKEFKTIEVFTEEDLEKVREEERKGNFVRVKSHIPVANKLDLDKVFYFEVGKDIVIPETIDYRTMIADYVKQQDPALLPLLQKHL